MRAYEVLRKHVDECGATNLHLLLYIEDDQNFE